MSSYIHNPVINDNVISPIEPLFPGNYYLIDCSQPIANFLNVPPAIRMEGIADGDEISEYESLAMDLSDVVSVVCVRDYQTSLDYFIEEFLDAGLRRHVDDLIQCSIYEPNKTYSNTYLQRAHADALEQLGHDLVRIFNEFNLYDCDGVLDVEFAGLLGNGLAAFRKATNHYL